MSIIHQLTIIIPFLNEKYEVENTVQSIISHSNGDVDIILINDASDDGFDYQSVADKYNVTYIVNTKRLGVAASRDLGVNLCKTPYFLLLDAHMRFYDNLWVQRIVDALEADKRRLLCCRTKTLNLANGLLMEARGKRSSFGGRIDFNKWQRFCEPNFTFNKIADTTLPEESIVCVLGAGYACSKEYWQYLKGLDGLIFYGNDETYISIKVWLEGGSCQLLKEVVIGHIYRSGPPPYSIDGTPRLYNRLFISELFFPPKLKKELNSQIRLFQYKILPEALFTLHSSRDKITQFKNYYQKIFTRDISFFIQLNNKVFTQQSIMVDNINDILASIAARAEQQPMPDIGLLQGRMGLSIFLFHYAQFTGQEGHTALAEKTLENLLENVKEDTHYGFATGLSGIGWGIEYLRRHGFVGGDTSEILEDFDKKIMELNPLRAFSLSRDYGFGGIVLYLLSRLYTIEAEGCKNPFDKEYLASVYERIKLVVEQRDTSCDCLDVFLEFMYYYEGQQPIAQPEIYDAWCLLNAANTPLQDLDLGLVGAAGVGLKLMLESNAGAPGKGAGMAATFPKITACYFSQHSHFNA